MKTVTVICDGNAQFRFSDQRDGLGNRLDLRLKPDGDRVHASFSYYKPNSFFQLGASNTKDMPDWEVVDTSKLKGDTEAVILGGQLYYFKIDEINGTDIELLFKTEEE
ncbi:MAG: hypothetical protein L3J39_09270 [Verrucomicrobiales bacterium]|nr:hypothetical protein [Verrucomicrobiales bacterium]